MLLLKRYKNSTNIILIFKLWVDGASNSLITSEQIQINLDIYLLIQSAVKFRSVISIKEASEL